ncbi:MAG: uridine diphosphate-N-acetylglucosamine-binding protein YvcK [Clostridia bacterium]|nr:uridine diphosphate-N-acetylglucosamine-binding protein YvcK [Clostridia bacterium]
MARGPRVVALGGGTGLSTLLHGIKEYTYNVTAVVTVTDDGGSSGRLRGELGILPPGDIRNVLVALADTEPLMERLFQHRFGRGQLKGHTLGNLFIGALAELLGSFEEALRASSRVLAVRGEVLPSTVDDVRLVATFPGGHEVAGETRIAEEGRTRGRIVALRLDPPDCRPVPAALDAIAAADVILIGPGSLYTSIAPNLLVPGVAEAIRRSPAYKVFVVNVMTQPGETIGFTALDHYEAVESWLGRGVIDAVVVNTGRIAEERLRGYRSEQAAPVEPSLEALASRGVKVISGDLVTAEGLVRHDSHKLARVIMGEVLRAALKDSSRLVERLVLAERLGRVPRRRKGRRP